MKLKLADEKKLVAAGIIKLSSLGENKGATLVIYKGKGFYVWKDSEKIYLKKKWFWSRKYAFAASDLFA